MNIHKGLRAVLCIALLFVGRGASADAAAAWAKQAEVSMLVTGAVQIDAQGKVTGFSLDKRKNLSADVIKLLDKAVPKWTFEPELVDGKPVNVSTDMSIRLVAREIDANSYIIGIRSAAFGDRTGKPEERVMVRGRLTPPSYPADLDRARVSGTVYLLVRIARDGQVVDAIAEQVNLRALADDKEMARWRYLLEAASVRRAKLWRFIPPTQGRNAGEDFWVVRVPIVFIQGNQSVRYDNTWDTYVPGPRQSDPWTKTDDAEGAAFSPDALPPGNAYLAGSGLRLLTALTDS